MAAPPTGLPGAAGFLRRVLLGPGQQRCHSAEVEQSLFGHAPARRRRTTMITPPEPQPPPAISAIQAFAGLLGLLTFARLSLDWNLPLPFCGLKRLTGVPCPFCGGTRCLQACSSFDFADALRWNPLVFLACIGTALWFCLWTGDQLSRR